MTDDKDIACLQEERNEFENEVFEVPSGITTQPMQPVDEYYDNLGSSDAPRVFSYQEAHEALAEVSKSLQLLHMIKAPFSCPQDEEEDTDENMVLRKLIDRLEGELR